MIIMLSLSSPLTQHTLYYTLFPVMSISTTSPTATVQVDPKRIFTLPILANGPINEPWGKVVASEP